LTLPDSFIDSKQRDGAADVPGQIIKHKTTNQRHKTTNQSPKKHLKNIRADLSAAKASALSLDSQRPGHQLLPWILAIE